MPVDFKVSRADGDTKVFTPDQIAQGLAQSGQKVLGVSPDGMAISVQGPKGPVAIPMEQIFAQRGLKMESAVPQNANYQNINNGWRAAMSSLPSDAARRMYLTEQFQKAGIQNPQISGTGRDWYIFDPESKQYHGLTNNPQWDSSDLVEAGMEAPRFAGAALGAGAGAVGGPVGSMAGAAAGGAAGDALARGVNSYFDPDVGHGIAQNPWETAGDIGMKSALDAAGVGVGGLAAKAVGKFAAPVSNLVRGAGGFAENAGRVVNKVAGAVDNDFGREVIGSQLPLTGPTIITGNLARLPNQAVRGMAKLPGWVGKKIAPLAQQFPENSPTRAGITSAADSLRGITEMLYQKSGLPTNPTNTLRNLAKEGGAWLGGGKPAAAVGSEDILGNAGTEIGNRIRGRTIQDRMRMAQQYGISPEQSYQIAEETTAPSMLGHVGAKIGRGLETLEGMGRGLENIGKGAVGAGLKATRGASYLMGKSGALARNASYLTEPLEGRSYLRYGSEELARPKLDLADPLQAQRNRARLNPSVLAEE